jgi:hypothetical protein
VKSRDTKIKPRQVDVEGFSGTCSIDLGRLQRHGTVIVVSVCPIYGLQGTQKRSQDHFRRSIAMRQSLAAPLVKRMASGDGKDYLVDV